MSFHLGNAISKESGRISKFSIGGFQPGGGFGGFASGICGNISDPTTRAICEAGAGLIPSGGGGGGGNGGRKKRRKGAFQPLTLDNDDRCIFPSRLDPVSGQCKLFLGSQEGADPGRAVVGGFGLPAMVPDVVGQITRRDGSSGPILRCMRTMVLGTDNLCYPKAVLPRRSKFRKWRGDPRPAVSAGDVRAIRKAAAAKDRVLNLAKDVGLFASKSRPAPRSKPHQHLIAAPAKQLRVISEETN